MRTMSQKLDTTWWRNSFTGTIQFGHLKYRLLVKPFVFIYYAIIFV